MSTVNKNPFRPGAGHMPPYLAGRNLETKEFIKLLKQDIILENVIITGLRGLGKTVLLESFKPLAVKEGWLWAGTDLTESSTISEESIAIRILADLALITSSITAGEKRVPKVGFTTSEIVNVKLTFETLRDVYASVHGLVIDRLKHVMSFVWEKFPKDTNRGIIFAYDEAQNLCDHSKKGEYPLSLLLDLFQSLQRKGIPFMLVLTGLPTLFPKLVDARAFAERMFHVIYLNKLSKQASRLAIMKPIEENDGLMLSRESVNTIIDISGGYPYFIQFICREIYDIFIQKMQNGEGIAVPTAEIVKKLDTDFFYGRWAKATDRQRELLAVIAKLNTSDQEFTVQEIVDESKKCLKKSFSSSNVNQLLSSLSNNGLIYKNRHGKYSFAVPLLDQYINRQAVL